MRHHKDGWLYAKSYSQRLDELKVEMPETRIKILSVMARDYAAGVIASKNEEIQKLSKAERQAWRDGAKERWSHRMTSEEQS